MGLTLYWIWQPSAEKAAAEMQHQAAEHVTLGRDVYAAVAVSDVPTMPDVGPVASRVPELRTSIRPPGHE